MLLILSYGHLFALDKESTLKIYHHVFAAFIPNSTIHVFTNDEEYKRVFAFSKRMTLEADVQNADIALITNHAALRAALMQKESIEKKNIILFVTDYHLLKRSEDVVGAFYWRKGRSQLLFIQKRLDKKGIVLPAEFKRFTVDKL